MWSVWEAELKPEPLPWPWGSSGVCVIRAQLSPVPVTSERGTCTSQQTALSPCSLPQHRWQTPFPCFITTNKKKLKSNLLLSLLSQVRGPCQFSVARKCYTTHFWATLTLIAWQNINFIQVIQNFNSMLLHSYRKLKQNCKHTKVSILDYRSQSKKTSISIAADTLLFSWQCINRNFKNIVIFCFIHLLRRQKLNY